MGRRDRNLRRQLGFAATLGFALCLACAQPMPPPGGPVDQTPPSLVAMTPDSGTVGLSGTRVLRFAFSEKMERQAAYRWLSLYPPAAIRDTKWHGLREAEVLLEDPLPADTVIVVEVLPQLKDAHGVAYEQGRRYPIATADSLPRGEITGGLLFDNTPLAGAVVTLLPAQPETLQFDLRPLLRRAVADSLGRFSLPWLETPSGPFLLEAFQDNDHNLRAGENEPRRVWPDTVSLTAGHDRVDLGLLTVYAPTAAGRLVGRLAGRPDRPGTVIGYSVKIAAPDSGWTPRPQLAAVAGRAALPDTGLAVIPKAGPGLVRAIFFVDASGDSLLSPMPAAAGDSSGTWVLEPWALVDSLAVEPGLDTPFPPPVWPDTLTVWPSPFAHADTTAAPADTTGDRR